jgi:ABC-type antimicrobial peptide transport system permease subunit
MTGMEMTGGVAAIVVMLIAVIFVLFYWLLPILAAASSVPRADRWHVVRVATASLWPMILNTLVSRGTLLFAQYKPIHFDAYRLLYVLAALLVAGISCIWSHRRALRPMK